ncbi:MAG: HAMP domain-containing protein [Armatimonadetes bacterium]|nr:HAMP domain-containing protein [Armatimonadota bacterium]
MSSTLKGIIGRYLPGFISVRRNGGTVPVATKLVVSYLLIIGITIAVFAVVGTHLIGRIVMSEAQASVRNNLNAAREILHGKLGHVNDVVRLSAGRFFLRDAMLSGGTDQIAGELARIREDERLDVLTVTDRSGNVLLRTSNPKLTGDNVSHDELVAAVMQSRKPAAGVSLVPAADLRKESPALAEQAYFKIIETPMAAPREATEETAGMMLKAAAPILDSHGNLLGILYGGILLNRNFEIVDKIKQTVFQDVEYKGHDIGTSTIFLNDVRISTNVRAADGTRAVGTRIAEDVYNQVIVSGNPWIGRAYVVNNWYITAYEPIESFSHKIIGILYVGVLERKYVDLRKEAVSVLLALTLTGALLSMSVSYFISRKVSASVRQLVSASREVARGNLDATVEIRTNDELQDLADSFNNMASALKQRDAQLKEYARKRIMESERLAITGQLAAGVAHELNNPLQGIVAYTHLLLEKAPPEEQLRETLGKVVDQAGRCRDIVRGLLDYARPVKPHKRPSDVNSILQQCISLVENQAQFHNIQVIKEFQEGLPLAVVDPAQIQQVVMNMIINAAEAMGGVGRLTLSTRADPDGGHLEFKISDTGHGIRPEDMERVFDPFFTTKNRGHGTGLGLSISFGIVKEHGGTILVESEVGEGTSFIVRLPVKAVGEA